MKPAYELLRPALGDLLQHEKPHIVLMTNPQQFFICTGRAKEDETKGHYNGSIRGFASRSNSYLQPEKLNDNFSVLQQHKDL